MLSIITSNSKRFVRNFLSDPDYSLNTVESRFNDLRFNDIPGVTINIRFPGKSYSKMYGAEPRFNDIRFNDIPGLTMGILFPESKIFPGITIKSTWQTRGNAVFITKQTLINKHLCFYQQSLSLLTLQQP